MGKRSGHESADCVDEHLHHRTWRAGPAGKMCTLAAAERDRACGRRAHPVARSKGEDGGDGLCHPQRAPPGRPAAAAGAECRGTGRAAARPSLSEQGPWGAGPARAPASIAPARPSSGRDMPDAMPAAGRAAPAHGIPELGFPRCAGRGRPFPPKRPARIPLARNVILGRRRGRPFSPKWLAAGLRGAAARQTKSSSDRAAAPRRRGIGAGTRPCAWSPAAPAPDRRFTAPRPRSHTRRAGRHAGSSRSRRAPRRPAAPRRAGCTRSSP